MLELCRLTTHSIWEVLPVRVGVMAYDDLEGDCWKVSDGGQVFIEPYEYDGQSRDGVHSKDLNSSEGHQVMRWVRSLPWRGGVVMLHMGW